MNMTSEDTVTETPDKFGSQPKMTPEQFELFQAKLAKLQKDPEFIRAMQNRQRAQAEFEPFQKCKGTENEIRTEF